MTAGPPSMAPMVVPDELVARLMRTYLSFHPRDLRLQPHRGGLTHGQLQALIDGLDDLGPVAPVVLVEMPT